MAEPASAGPTINGWLVLYHPVFRARYIALGDEVRVLKGRLRPEDYVQHPRVKLFAAVRHLVSEVVPANPNAEEFRLRKGLSKHRRAKGHGLPARFHLYWVFSERPRVIIFTYLNDEATLRKAGAKSDPYVIYQKMVERGDIGANFDENYRQWQRVMGWRPRPHRLTMAGVGPSRGGASNLGRSGGADVRQTLWRGVLRTALATVTAVLGVRLQSPFLRRPRV